MSHNEIELEQEREPEPETTTAFRKTPLTSAEDAERFGNWESPDHALEVKSSRGRHLKEPVGLRVDDLRHTPYFDALKPKQRAFVEAYLGDCFGNASQSAKRAGYKGSYSAVRQRGSKLLTKPYIQRAISELKEQYDCMGRGEMLAHLSRQSRASLTPFWKPVQADDGEMVMEPNLVDAWERGYFDNLKMFQIDRQLRLTADGAEVVHESIKMQLKSCMDAKKLLTRIKGMDAPHKVEISGPDGGPVPVMTLALDRLSPELVGALKGAMDLQGRLDPSKLTQDQLLEYMDAAGALDGDD